jgi:hypothetical protein
VFKKTILILLMVIINTLVYGQTLTYSFTDPCTKITSFFSVPASGTTIFFLNKSATFTSADVASGAFGAWVNQTYADYRKVMPCSVQSTQVVQNQITSQIIGSTVQSVVGSIMGSAQSAAMSTTTTTSTSSSGGDDAAGKGKTESDKKSKPNTNGNNNSSSSGSNNNSGNNSNNGNSGSSNSSSTTSGSSTTSSGNKDSKKEEGGSEVVGSTSMSIDAHNNSSESSSSSDGGGSGKGGKAGSGAARSNPILVSSDLTTAQNLDKTFTPILNLGMAQSSMTGMSSWGLTGMIWFNFKQFALSGRYTKIHFSKGGKLKFIHNFNLTSVYSYGNILGFVGYSGILNAGKWGVTGFNLSAAGTLVSEDKSTFLSPSITAFYTRPFTATKRLNISPELYIISTPLMYSTKDKVTTTDRTFSAFVGSGFDYQITKRFKFNFNYKANLSTNPDFPVLSFFLIGSKVNL